MDKSISQLIDHARANGAEEARPLAVGQFVSDPRAALKCRFGCPRWGRTWTCPPNIGLDEGTVAKAMARYEMSLVLRSPGRRVGQRAALAVEREAMLRHGMYFALALALCVHCEPCAWPEPCPHPEMARPAMDALGYDMIATVARAGFAAALDDTPGPVAAWYTVVLLR